LTTDSSAKLFAGSTRLRPGRRIAADRPRRPRVRVLRRARHRRQCPLSRKRLTARKPVHKGRKRGATLRFTLSETARVRVAFERKADGRRVKVLGKRRCKLTKANAAKPRCTRYVAAGRLTATGKAGANKLAVNGKIAGKTLKPGRYRLTLSAVDAGGLRSKSLRIGFRVLSP
jgi:hypothetical protein